jgi:hypothetical protein
MVCSKLKFETTSERENQSTTQNQALGFDETHLKNRAHPAEKWMSVVAM